MTIRNVNRLLAQICLAIIHLKATSSLAASNIVPQVVTTSVTGSPAQKSASMISTVVAVTVNGVRKGDFFIFISETGDCLIKSTDLELMGIHGAEGISHDIEGDVYLSLGTVREFNVIFDEKMLALNITSVPDLLGKQTINLLPVRHKNVQYPNENDSAFLNYKIDYADGSTNTSPTIGFASEVGIRLSDYLAISSFSSRFNDKDSSSVRLMSNVTRDWRGDMTRLKIGDFFANSGDLGSTLNIGGISYSKNYAIDPYFVNHPMAEITGATATPSEAQIYLNDVYLKKIKLLPGEFQIHNLNYYGGDKNVRVVIKDMFGREQEISQNYYFTDTPLRKGLHEYSYNIGLARQSYGVVSNQYKDLASSAFHRYGVSDDFMIGAGFESLGSRTNAGTQALLRLSRLGTFSVAVSSSHNPDVGSALASQFNYRYQKDGFNTGLAWRHFGETYTVANDNVLSDAPLKTNLNIYAGYANKTFGNIGASFNNASYYHASSRYMVSMNYTKTIFKNMNFFGRVNHISSPLSENSLQVGLTWHFGGNANITASHSKSDNDQLDSLQITQNTPAGEGYGYRLKTEHSVDAAGSSDMAYAYLQHNSKYGIYTADYRTVGNSNTYQLSAAGAVSYVGSTFNFSRPIYDSFGLVQVGDIEGVRVLSNNQIVGKTNAQGQAFVPNMHSYLDNQISINDKDVPIEYELKAKEQFVSPLLRSGSIIKFEANRIHAFSGRLQIKTDATTIKPVGNNEFTLKMDRNADSKPSTFSTVKDGEFYIENIKPGDYKGEFVYQSQSCVFNLTIPESKESFVDLGRIVCEQIH